MRNFANAISHFARNRGESRGSVRARARAIRSEIKRGALHDPAPANDTPAHDHEDHERRNLAAISFDDDIRR